MAQKHELSDTLRFLLTVLFARARLVLATTAFCVVGAILACAVLPKTYVGDFSILIKSPEIDRSIFGENADVVVKPGRVQANTLSDEFEILTSPGLAQVVAEAYHNDGHLPDHLQIKPGGASDATPAVSEVPAAGAQQVNRLAGILREKLEVTPVRESDVIHVRLSGSNREELDRLVKLYAAAYQRYRAGIWFDAGALRFFQDQAASSLAAWKKCLAALQETRKEAGDLDPAVERARLEQIVSEYQRTLNDLETSIAADSSAYETLLSLDPAQAVTFLTEETNDNRLFWQLSEEIAKAKAHRHELAKNHADGSIILSKVDRELEAFYRDYKSQLGQMLRNDLSRLSARRDALLSNTRSIRSRLSQLGETEHRAAVLQQDADLYRDQYNMYSAKVLEMSALNNMRAASTSSVSILSPPRVGIRPIWPDPRLLIPLAGFLGLILGLVVAALSSLLNGSFSLPEEVTRELGIPVVASFPELDDQGTLRAGSGAA